MKANRDRRRFLHWNSVTRERTVLMTRCDVCGNEGTDTFTVTMDGREHVFDSFECAARAFPQLGSTVLPQTWDAALQGMVPSAAMPTGLGRQARWISAAGTGSSPYSLDDDKS